MLDRFARPHAFDHGNVGLTLAGAGLTLGQKMKEQYLGIDPTVFRF